MRALNAGLVLLMADSRCEQLYHMDWCMRGALDEALPCSESAMPSSNLEMLFVVPRWAAPEQAVEVAY